MSVTEEGNNILRELADYVQKLQGLSSLEQYLLARLNIKRRWSSSPVIPIKSRWSKREMGRAAARQLLILLKET
jgi:hypothetical protein